MSIDAISSSFKPIEAIKDIVKPQAGNAVQQKDSFGHMFENALKEVDQMQMQAEDQIEGLVLKKDGVTPHGAMVALEKADTAFQLMSAIRGKIIRAYEEVIRTQV